MQTQLSKLREFMTDNDHRSALKLAAGWAELGVHKESITRAWQAIQSPRFYEEIGKNPKELIELGVQAIKERYGI